VEFLQEVERVSRLSAAEPRQQPARAVAAPSVLPPRLHKLQNLARAKRIDLHFMPPGMHRHDSNTSTARLAFVGTSPGRAACAPVAKIAATLVAWMPL